MSSPLLDAVLAALEEYKAQDVQHLDVRELTDVMDDLVVASGTSSRHVKSIAENTVVALKKQGFNAMGVEGLEAGEWVLVDLGDVVLHVMQPQTREFYDLERLWTVGKEQPVNGIEQDKPAAT